jgi:hypothetical protein
MPPEVFLCVRLPHFEYSAAYFLYNYKETFLLSVFHVYTNVTLITILTELSQLHCSSPFAKHAASHY